MIAEPGGKKLPPFGPMAPIPYRASFGDAEYARFAQGLAAREMEDKWLAYLDGATLCFHRSWTGQGIYRVTFQRSGDRHLVAEALCATAMLAKSDGHYQSQLLDFLIRNLLFGEARPFPLPPALPDTVPGLYQHAISGTRYPEEPAVARPWWRFWG